MLVCFIFYLGMRSSISTGIYSNRAKPSPTAKKGYEINFAPHIEVYPENNIPLMQAFDVNAGTFIEHVNSGRLRSVLSDDISSSQCLCFT
jgi:hypothetical protein